MLSSLCLHIKRELVLANLPEDISVTQKTAWHMLHRIRLAMTTKSFEKPLSGIVEIDETFIGGTAHGKGKGNTDKKPVFGIVQRGGKARIETIKNIKSKTLKPIIRKNVTSDSIVMTDNYAAYKGLKKEYKDHQIISHATHKYVNGICHTNTIEGFWSLLKRGIVGIYHHVSPEHLHRYCEEFKYRYNSRKLDDTERFGLLLSVCDGRLTYRNLIHR